MKTIQQHINGKKQAKATPFFSPNTIQPKLSIGQPNDKYEQEADAMADQVMRMSKTSTAIGTGGEEGQTTPEIQTKCQACEEHDSLQKKANDGEKLTIQTKSFLQKKGENQKVTSNDLQTKLKNTKGGGSSLPITTNSFMSNAFGTDFNNVRVHTGGDAIQMNQDLNAKAFTHGSDIYFNKGEYSPTSSEGKRLLAHELTHVVQQGGSSSMIQRVVERESVSSSDQVLKRIGSTVNKVKKGKNQKSPIIENFKLLVKLSKHFDPGAPGQKSATNAFVYTCKCGWIDLGHFFISAAGSYLSAYFQQYGLFINGKRYTQGQLFKLGLDKLIPVLEPILDTVGEGGKGNEILEQQKKLLESGEPKDISLATGGYGTEYYQQLGKIIADLMGEAPEWLESEQLSAFTIEDFPSDAYGAAFGQEVWETVRYMKKTTAHSPIYKMMAAFFEKCGAVFPKGDTLCKMMNETSPGSCKEENGQFKYSKKDRGKPVQYTDHTKPYLLNSAMGLCGGKAEPIGPDVGKGTGVEFPSYLLNINSPNRSASLTLLDNYQLGGGFGTTAPTILGGNLRGGFFADTSLSTPWNIGNLDARASGQFNSLSSVSVSAFLGNSFFGLSAEADIHLDYEGLLKGIKESESQQFLAFFKSNDFNKLLKEWIGGGLSLDEFYVKAKALLQRRFPKGMTSLGEMVLERLKQHLSFELLPVYTGIRGQATTKLLNYIPVTQYYFGKGTGPSAPFLAAELGFLGSELFRRKVMFGAKGLLYGAEKIQLQALAGYDIYSKKWNAKLSIQNETLLGKKVKLIFDYSYGVEKGPKEQEDKRLQKILDPKFERQNEHRFNFGLRFGHDLLGGKY